jgi:hypothetical protein
MVAHGRVQNGVIVLDSDVRLAEGQVVTVLATNIGNAGLQTGTSRHSVLEIPPVSVGAILRPLTSGDDLLGEMLEGRS